MPDTKILIIEDDHFLSSILKGRLEKEGFTVEQAFDGEEGLKALHDSRPNLVLLDLIMPKKSGFEVLEAVSTDPELSQVPVIIASNLGQDSDVEKAKSLGAVDYFVKVRTSIDQLAEMIKNMVGQFAGQPGEVPTEAPPPAPMPEPPAPPTQPQ